MEPDPPDVVKNLNRIKAELNALATKYNLPSSPELLAVSKFQDVDVIEEAFSKGFQKAFGENYVKELVEKSQKLSKDVEWHFIGHLQSNKCRQLMSVPNLKRISTIDNVLLASKVNAACHDIKRDPLEVLIQVHATNEITKSGVPLAEAKQLVSHIREKCTALRFRGFLTIGHPTDEDQTRKAFNSVKALAQEVQLKTEGPLVLSFGMSADLDVAIECGSNQVRIGTAIFGPRRRPVKQESP